MQILELESTGNYHTWLDPKRTIENAEIISNKIVELKPELEADINQNLASLRKNLEEKDSEYSSSLESCENDSVLVSHNFLEPVAVSYGFNVDSLVNEDHFVGFSAQKFVETMKSKHEYIYSQKHVRIALMKQEKHFEKMSGNKKKFD